MIVPGRRAGYLSGCPFCMCSLGIPKIGTRFRIVLGAQIGEEGIVVEWPKKFPKRPNEFLAHFESDYRITSTELQKIQEFPYPPIPKWAPPLCMEDAGKIEDPIIDFCEKSFLDGKWKIDWDAFNEVVRKSWYKRLPLEAEELWLVLHAHGVPERSKKSLSEFYEKARNLLIYAAGRKPIKKRKIKPLSDWRIPKNF
jgi:hypothetical protein